MQTGSLRRPLDQIPHVSCAADGDIRELGEKINGLGGDIEQVCDCRSVAAGTQFTRLLGRDTKTTLLTEAIQDRRILELGQNTLMDEWRSPGATTAIGCSVAPE